MEGVCQFCSRGDLKNVGAHERFCEKNPDNARAQKKIASAVATAERPPGSTVADDKGRKLGKVPWTMKEIEKRFSIVEFTPQETLPVTWNGISIQCFKGVSQLMPSCFRSILIDRQRRMNQVRSIIQTNYGDITIGAQGGLPPE